MALLVFLLEAVLISLSGVMAPGPVTATVIGRGNESPHAGALVALGHGVVEVPLMVAVFLGLGALLDYSYVRATIALAGGLFLVVMSVGMFRSVRPGYVSSGASTRSPVLAGILLSLGNPYFLIWWATVGATLIFRSIRFGVFGFLLFALVHWLCDFVWSYFLSALSYNGGKFFGRGFQRTVFAVCGAFLLFFSGKLVLDAVRELVI